MIELTRRRFFCCLGMATIPMLVVSQATAESDVERGIDMLTGRRRHERRDYREERRDRRRDYRNDQRDDRRDYRRHDDD